jgi:hypothetical protein
MLKLDVNNLLVKADYMMAFLAKKNAVFEPSIARLDWTWAKTMSMMAVKRF